MTITKTQSDPRFTMGLGLDVARVLEQHGYPQLNDGQIIGLMAALFGYLYRGDEPLGGAQ